MNKGYAFGFLVVLLVLVLGFYVAFTGFIASRDALRAQPTSPSTTRDVQVTRSPTSPAPTATATFVTIPTPVLGITATLTAVVSTDATEPPSPPASPPAAASPTPPAAREPDTPVPVVQPPTSTPAPIYQFRLAGPPSAAPDYPSCCYLFGTVRDAAGNGLEGVQVQAFNEWTPPIAATTKGGAELGQWNIPIGRDAVTWNLVIIDASGNRISTQAPVQFDPNAANAYRVNWQRTY
jgi:hypothetical protein